MMVSLNSSTKDNCEGSTPRCKITAWLAVIHRSTLIFPLFLLFKLFFYYLKQAIALSYIPVANHSLPFSMDPEYQAAQRAYMRYHNQNPIFGISSKKARATASD
jgi:succinate dehydrogenase/fumarate reductase cytochrome b subunit